MRKKVSKEFLKKLLIEKSKKYQRKSISSMTQLNSKSNMKPLLLSVSPKKITSSKKKVTTKEALKSLKLSEYFVILISYNWFFISLDIQKRKSI